MANTTSFATEFRALMEKYGVAFDVDGSTVTLKGNDGTLVGFKPDAESEVWDRVTEHMVTSKIVL